MRSDEHAGPSRITSREHGATGLPPAGPTAAMRAGSSINVGTQEYEMHPVIVVMGVSGSGKSTIGALLAVDLEVPFADADDLHPIANIEKMASGVPLDDDDRRPWLEIVGATLADAQRSGTGLVIACSALKRAYRDTILAQAPSTRFVHLHGNREMLTARTEGRIGHFMPASLLDSQLAVLEPLESDEPGIVIDVAEPTRTIVETLAARLGD